MTRTDFIRTVARKCNVATKAQVKAVLETAEEVVMDVVRDGDKVPLLNCLYVTGRKMPARTMRNPYTGGKVDVPEHIVPKASFTHAGKCVARGGIKSYANGAAE